MTLYMLLTRCDLVQGFVLGVVAYMVLGVLVRGYSRRETGLDPAQAQAYRDYMWFTDRSMGLEPENPVIRTLLWPFQLVVDWQVADLSRRVAELSPVFTGVIDRNEPWVHDPDGWGRHRVLVSHLVVFYTTLMGPELHALLALREDLDQLLVPPVAAAGLVLGAEMAPGASGPVFMLVLDAPQGLIDQVNRALVELPRNQELLPGRRMLAACRVPVRVSTTAGGSK